MDKKFHKYHYSKETNNFKTNSFVIALQIMDSERLVQAD